MEGVPRHWEQARRIFTSGCSAGDWLVALVFAHWPIRPNEMTLEEYNMFQEYNAFKPDDTIDLNLETLKDVKKFYRKLQIILHPDRNKNVRLELFDKMQALYNKRYNNDRLNAQGENKDWKKSGV